MVNVICLTGPGDSSDLLLCLGDNGELSGASSARSSKVNEVPGYGGELDVAPPDAQRIGQLRRYAVPAEGSAITNLSSRDASSHTQYSAALITSSASSAGK